MDFEQAIIYHSKWEIAGSKPYFVLPNVEMRDYFNACAGAPEAALISWAAQYIKPHTTFIDIGAHVGTWGISLGLGRHCRVRSFEAQPWMSALCKAGFALNGMEGSVVTHSAIGDHDGQITMRVPKAVNHSTLTASGFDADGVSIQLETGGASIIEASNVLAQGFAEITVPVHRLDWFVLFPSLIKIDVEGAELDVLKGATNTIHANHPKILFECWQDERGQRKEELFRFLNDELEYRVVNVNGFPEMYLAEPK